MAEHSFRARRIALLAVIGPGILVAATGVGAGDLLTASYAGSRHGLVLLWAAWVGAILKWFLNEGIARWQMATGTTVLEGWTERLGRWIRWVFLGYLLVWSLFTAGALINACGVAGTGLLPLGDDLRASKIAWGVIHALAGLILVRVGGF
jgi:Mn2+/Fe2+ NRAMP family transporter